MAARLTRHCLLLLIMLLSLLLPTTAQDSIQDVIEMSVKVGFDSFFRAGQWTPVRVALTNNGESVAGRLVIRPETSGTVVGNAFSTAVDLPSGAQKSAIIYIQARTFPDSIRVELIDDAGGVRATKEAGLIDLQPQDQLYAVVSGPTTQVPNLSGVHIGGYVAEQALWQIHELPFRALGLESLDLLLIIDVDTDGLSSGQRRALRRWVQAGGHLIVIGGPGGQRTAQGLTDILPLIPEDSRSLDEIGALARFSGDSRSALQERTIVATGRRHDEAQVLVEQDGVPLLLRRQIGAGIVDFLAVDPTLEPLASWANSSMLWMKLLATRAPHPTWVEGFSLPEWGAEAVANLPGIDLLPPLQTLCLFLSLYIVLIGPLNYFILSRINRNGWGWITIPLVIIGFTGIAWTVGFSLRGAEIIVSRLGVVQSAADGEEARVDQYVGLLSPRRASYSLEAPPDHFLAVSGATVPSSIFASNTIQTATEITQGTEFGAYDFAIDGGIFANFVLAGYIPRPAISGSFTLDFELLESGRMAGAYQGVIRNDSDITLRDAVILGHGLVFPLIDEFAPGDILALDRQALRAEIGNYPPQPNPLEITKSRLAFGTSPFAGTTRNRTLKQIQGERYLRSRAFLNVQSVDDKQAAREQSFLASFVLDQFESTARSTSLYLVGWQDAWPRDLEISGAGWSSIDTSLYIIELDVDIELPRERATLTSEYFSWISLSRVGITDNGTEDFNLYEGQAVEFLFNPLPGLVMDNVDHMFVEVDRGGGYAQSLDIELFNWISDEYDEFNYRDGDELELANPHPYLGADNMVQIRLQFDQGIGTARVRQIRIEQTGAYD